MLYNNTDTALKIVESLHAADNQDIRFDDSSNFDIKDGKITISGIPVSDNAAKDLLDYMQIKKGFIKVCRFLGIIWFFQITRKY